MYPLEHRSRTAMLTAITAVIAASLMLMLAATSFAASDASTSAGPYGEQPVPTRAPVVRIGSSVQMNNRFVRVNLNCLAPVGFSCITEVTVRMRHRVIAEGTFSLRRGQRVVRLRLNRRVRRPSSRARVSLRTFGTDGSIRRTARNVRVR